MKSKAGPNPSRKFNKGLPPSSIGFALISTPWSIKNASRPGSTKEGTVVVKWLTVLGVPPGVAPRSIVFLDSPLGAALFSPAVLDSPLGTALFSPAGGQVTGDLKRAVMTSPWLWIASTLRLATSFLKKV